MKYFYSVWVTLTFIFSMSVAGLQSQVIVELSPIEFSPEDDMEERISIINGLCQENLIDLDSTVQFVLAGCDSLVLISMDAIRSNSNPFDPNEVGEGEILVKGPPYTHDFEEEGSFVIFCDASFKSVATCLTIVANLDELNPIDPTAAVIPTLDQWSLIILALLLSILIIAQSKIHHCDEHTGVHYDL